MKLIAAKDVKSSSIKVYETETGTAVIVRTRPNPLTWTLSANNPLGRNAMTAREFAESNRIPLVSAE